MNRIGLAALAAAFLAVAATPVAAASYTGTVTEAAVVWITDGTKPPAVSDAQMHQTKKKFVPEVLIVPLGTPVRFPNDDEFYHNVFSDGDATPFDLGLYDVGPGKTVTFDKVGTATVRCHVHVSMHATILVVDGPYARVEKAGGYEIASVRPGKHTLHVWTAEGGEKRSMITVGG